MKITWTNSYGECYYHQVKFLPKEENKNSPIRLSGRVKLPKVRLTSAGDHYIPKRWPSATDSRYNHPLGQLNQE